MEIQPDFSERLALFNAHRVEYGDISVKYIGRDAFISNKRSTGRKKDMADLEALGEE